MWCIGVSDSPNGVLYRIGAHFDVDGVSVPRSFSGALGIPNPEERIYHEGGSGPDGD